MLQQIRTFCQGCKQQNRRINMRICRLRNPCVRNIKISGQARKLRTHLKMSSTSRPNNIYPPFHSLSLLCIPIPYLIYFSRGWIVPLLYLIWLLNYTQKSMFLRAISNIIHFTSEVKHFARESDVY